jgi:hypothetical protein
MADKKQTLVVEVTTKADQAKQQLAELDRKAKELEGKPIEIPVDVKGTEDVKAKVGDVSRAADGAKNAFSNLAGNTAQDMASMSGSLGGVGVAIGQLVEYTSDAAQGADGLTGALKGAATMVGPLAALSVATLVVTQALEGYKARQAELKRIHEESVAGFAESSDAIKEWGDALDEAVSQGTLDRISLLNKSIKDALGPDTLKVAAIALSNVGQSMDDLGESVTKSDQDFQSWAESQLKAAGASDDAARRIATIVGATEKSSHAFQELSRQGIDVKKMGLEDAIKGLEEFDDQAQNHTWLTVADDNLKAASAVKENAAAVAQARSETDNSIDAWTRYLQIQQDVKAAEEEATRVREEGAAAAEAAGSIIEQVGRQEAEAADLAADAMDKAKAAQDNWLLHEVDYQAGVDDFTESVMKLAEQTKKQAEAGDEGAGSFDGNTKAALDNRDALGDVYKNALNVIESMKDTGFSVDGARTAQDNMAQSAYDLAIQMGFPIAKAQEIKDKISQIPPSVTSDVVITEQGYNDVKAKKDDLEQDMESTLFINGVLDRSVVEAVAALPPGAFGRSVAPSAAIAPAAATVGLLAAPATTASTAPSRTTTVNVNMSGSIVADSFELQRVVSRAVRQGVRINGARRYQP